MGVFGVQIIWVFQMYFKVIPVGERFLNFNLRVVKIVCLWIVKVAFRRLV